jgi:divalent metal cation (Fe/Co/Zn/Cd) transporter
MWSGARLIRESVGGLMDEGDPGLERSMRDVLGTETVGRGLLYHELRYRRSGRVLWVEFHLLFPPGTLLADAHRHATDIELSLTEALPSPSRIVSHLETWKEHDDHHAEPLKHA